MFPAKVNGFALDDLSGKPVLQSRFACQCFMSSTLRFNFPSFPALLCLAFPPLHSLPCLFLPCRIALHRVEPQFFVPLSPPHFSFPIAIGQCAVIKICSFPECENSAVYAEKARKNTVFLFFYAFVPIGFRLRFRL